MITKVQHDLISLEKNMLPILKCHAETYSFMKISQYRDKQNMDKYASHMCLPVNKETPNLDGTVQGEYRIIRNE